MLCFRMFLAARWTVPQSTAQQYVAAQHRLAARPRTAGTTCECVTGGQQSYIGQSPKESLTYSGAPLNNQQSIDQLPDSLPRGFIHSESLLFPPEAPAYILLAPVSTLPNPRVAAENLFVNSALNGDFPNTANAIECAFISQISTWAPRSECRLNINYSLGTLHWTPRIQSLLHKLQP